MKKSQPTNNERESFSAERRKALKRIAALGIGIGVSGILLTTTNEASANYGVSGDYVEDGHYRVSGDYTDSGGYRVSGDYSNSGGYGVSGNYSESGGYRVSGGYNRSR